MKNVLLTIFSFYASILFAQQVHVRYKFVRSPVVTIYDNLFINKNGNVLSVQDSSTLSSKFVNQNPMGGNFKFRAVYHISDIGKENKRDFFYNDTIEDKMFFVLDKNVAKPHWIIDKKDVMKIAGYQCYRAETIFRGSKIVAYYTKDIPYSTGPFKFFGLPGLILYTKVGDTDYFIWKADLVELDNKSEINFKPKLNQFDKIEIQEFVKLKDDNSAAFDRKLRADVPKGATILEQQYNKRFGIEQIYEWEK